MIHINQAIIVEGKYDKIKLSSIIDGVIIPTNGFSVFKDKEKVALIKHFAEHNGIIILTDSDSAGFVIRNYLKGIIAQDKITNVYIPDIFGKEKRKDKPSKEGKLGVEGIDAKTIIDCFNKSGILTDEGVSKERQITRIDLYDDGLIGADNSSIKRGKLLSFMDLPEHLTTSSLLEVINSMYTIEDYKKVIDELFGNSGEV